LHHPLDDRATARTTFAAAAQSCRRLRDWGCYALANQNLAMLAYESKNLTVTLSAFADALRQLSPELDPKLAANIWSNYGAMQGRAGLFSSAQRSYVTAMRGYAGLGDCGGVRWILAHSGNLMVQLGTLSDAKNDLQQAVTTRTVALSPTDAYIAAVAHRRYEALGKPMPTFTIARTTELRPYNSKPADVNLFVLYPESCAACVSIPDTVDGLRKSFNVRAHAWTLIESDPNDKRPLPTQSVVHPPTKGSIAKDTPHVPPALYTSTPLMQQLGIEAVPCYIVTDLHGNIRFLSSGPTGWLRPDGNQDILIQVVMERILNHDDDERISKEEKRMGIMKSSPAP